MSRLITWLGDDFTGSAAVLEVLSFAGIDAVLFSGVPSEAMRNRFSNAQAIGIATTARAQTPEWMRGHLPALVQFLDQLKAPILHYKICSTFDSAPHVGNMGVAIETVLSVRASDAVPIVTAAPQMRRYQVFGNLFAGTLDGTYRLDRHPIMSRHPVTPMTEADLMAHLALQTKLQTDLIDLEDLKSDPNKKMSKLIMSGKKLISIDSFDELSEKKAGQLIWEHRNRLRVVAGSQGIEYALVRHWMDIGIIAPAPRPMSAEPVSQIAAVSGSVSEITAEQIQWSGQNGFALIPFDAASAIASPEACERAIHTATEAALLAAQTEASPLVFSACGPDDPAVIKLRQKVSQTGLTLETANHQIGLALGQILDRVLTKTRLRRAVISGGDTSGHGMTVLGLEALRALAPTIPGAALCTAYGDSPHDGLQIALKGGQMGSRDFFDWIRAGGGPR